MLNSSILKQNLLSLSLDELENSNYVDTYVRRFHEHAPDYYDPVLKEAFAYVCLQGMMKGYCLHLEISHSPPLLGKSGSKEDKQIYKEAREYNLVAPYCVKKMLLVPIIKKNKV